MTYELHPLCTLFPRMAGAEFSALVDDIEANGLRQPIVTHGGMILDGGNRYRACLEAGIEPKFVEFEGDNLVSFVLSANLHRRHMSAGQQAAIVASAQDWGKAQTVGKPKSDNIDQLATVDQRAAQSGASRSTQKMADKVAKEAPELAKQVAHGEVSLPKAVAQITNKAKKRPLETAPLPEEQMASNDEIIEAQHTIAELAAENERLSDMLAVNSADLSEEGKAMAAETIAELRQRVHVLEQENDALKASRDTYMQKVSEMQRQVNLWRKKAEKVAA